MTVGNIATLRPLFRTILNKTVRKNYGSRSYGRSGASRFAPAYELSGHRKGDGSKFSTDVKELRGHKRDSELSDGDSQTQIMGHDGNTQIMVSRQVNIMYE
jgi:hypothetical protein